MLLFTWDTNNLKFSSYKRWFIIYKILKIAIQIYFQFSITAYKDHLKTGHSTDLLFFVLLWIGWAYLGSSALSCWLEPLIQLRSQMPKTASLMCFPFHLGGWNSWVLPGSFSVSVAPLHSGVQPELRGSRIPKGGRQSCQASKDLGPEAAQCNFCGLFCCSKKVSKSAWWKEGETEAMAWWEKWHVPEVKSLKTVYHISLNRTLLRSWSPLCAPPLNLPSSCTLLPSLDNHCP